MSREILLEFDLPIFERDFIQPGGISSLLVVAIHLEGHIDFAYVVAPRRICAIHVVRYAIIRERNINHLRGCALELPGEMVPCVCRRSVHGIPVWIQLPEALPQTSH